MTNHPAFTPGRAAVITGGASGIGLAMAERCADLGMSVCLADVNAVTLAQAEAALQQRLKAGASVLSAVTDVSRRDDVERLKTAAYDRFGDVAVLMNNAGVEGGGTLFAAPERWRQILDVNLMGVVNGVQVFGPDMLAASKTRPAAIINTGSKQGITCPPGDTAYNVSKAGIKVVTEALAHEIRQHDGAHMSAHLLIPGFTFTGFTRVHTQEKPKGAWMPEQVIDFLMARIAAGDFYVLCPDNDVSRELDVLRIRWAAGDITENRPPLSRWHADYKAAFQRYLDENLPKK